MRPTQPASYSNNRLVGERALKTVRRRIMRCSMDDLGRTYSLRPSKGHAEEANEQATQPGDRRMFKAKQRQP